MGHGLRDKQGRFANLAYMLYMLKYHTYKGTRDEPLTRASTTSKQQEKLGPIKYIKNKKLKIILHGANMHVHKYLVHYISETTTTCEYATCHNTLIPATSKTSVRSPNILLE